MDLIWGSDWPHVHMTRDMPDDGHLVDLFNEWVSDAALRKKAPPFALDALDPPC